MNIPKFSDIHIINQNFISEREEKMKKEALDYVDVCFNNFINDFNKVIVYKCNTTQVYVKINNIFNTSYVETLKKRISELLENQGYLKYSFKIKTHMSDEIDDWQRHNWLHVKIILKEEEEEKKKNDFYSKIIKFILG
jgi:hypothetical protein